jgi:hypothetical protein
MRTLRGSAHSRQGSVVAHYDEDRYTLAQAVDDLKVRARGWSEVRITVWGGGVCRYEAVIDCV